MNAPAPQHSNTSAPAGEAFVWFTGVGLLFGLGMVLVLVGVILTEGLSVFGSPNVVRVELKDGRVLLGPLAQNRLPPDKKFTVNGHFAEANRLLVTRNRQPVDWRL